MESYKQLSSLVEYATGNEMQKPDQNAFYDVANMIKARSDMPREAVRNFQKRIQTKNPKVLMLTIELMEFLTYTCEINLHSQFATKDFLLSISSILQAKNMEPANYKLPSNYDSKYKNCPKAKGGQPQSESYGSSGSGNYSQSYNQPSSSGGQFQNLDPKQKKLKADLDIVQQNIVLVNEMIDGHEIGTPVTNNDTLNDLISNLNGMTDKLANLIGTLPEGDMMSFTLTLNDDLIKTLERYKDLKRGRKPKPFKDNDVEEEVMQQIRKLELKDKQQQQQSSFDQFSEFHQYSGSKPQQQQYEQQKQPIQEKSKPPVVVKDLLDLDDDEPVQQQKPQEQKPQNQNQGSLPMDLFDDNSMSGSNTTANTNQQSQQQTSQFNFMGSQQPQNITHSQIPMVQTQYVSPTTSQQLQPQINYQQQNQQQQSQQDRYAALEGLGQQPKQYYQQPQQQFGVGYQQPQYQSMYQQGQQGGMGMGGMGGMGLTQPQQQMNPQSMYQQGYGQNQGQQQGYNPQGQQQTSMYQGYNQQGQGYQQQNYNMSVNTNVNMMSMSDSPEKKPFDDLDDMFGISSDNNKPQQKPQQQQQQQQQSSYSQQNNQMEDLF